jgi:PEP-CTERM putative exosortase interaction domain/Deltaproteobacterial GC-motif protein sorting domain
VKAPCLNRQAPEPASWAMMVAGFGLAGGMLRRRREDNGLKMA